MVDFFKTLAQNALVSILFIVAETAICMGAGALYGHICAKLRAAGAGGLLLCAFWCAAIYASSGILRVCSVFFLILLIIKLVPVYKLRKMPAIDESTLGIKYKKRVLMLGSAPLGALLLMSYVQIDAICIGIICVCMIWLLFVKNLAIKYHKKIFAAVADGALSTRKIRQWITLSRTKNPKGETHRFVQCAQIANRMAEAGSIDAWSGAEERYYFRPGYLKKLSAHIRSRISTSVYVFAEDLLKDKDFPLPFTELDLDIFVMETMPDVQAGHRDNRDVYLLAANQRGGGLCHCCRAHADTLHRTAYGSYCCDSCAALVKSVAAPLALESAYAQPALSDGSVRVVNENDLFTRVAPVKFCSSAKETVACALDEKGKWKYHATDGSLLMLEVPFDQHEEASRLTREITGTDMAFPCVLSLAQCRAIALLGLNDNIKIAPGGAVTCLNTRGITAEMISRTVSHSELVSLQESYGLSLDSNSGGAGRSVAMAASDVMEGYIKKLASGVLKGSKAGLGVGIGMVSMALFQYRDFVNYFSGVISGQDLARSLAGGSVGAVTSGIVGASFGMVPGMIAGTIASAATDAIVGKLSPSDAVRMQTIFEKEFRLLARDYLLSEEEISAISSYIASLDAQMMVMRLRKSDDAYRESAHILLPQIVKLCRERAS